MWTASSQRQQKIKTSLEMRQSRRQKLRRSNSHCQIPAPAMPYSQPVIDLNDYLTMLHAALSPRTAHLFSGHNDLRLMSTHRSQGGVPSELAGKSELLFSGCHGMRGRYEYGVLEHGG